jgi:hypothetical protein
MAASYTRFVIRTSIVQAAIILFNLVALASFFFIQVGSILFIVPAAIVDVIYLLNKEQIGIKRGAQKPSLKILRLALMIITLTLVLFSVVFFFEVIQGS